MLSYLITDGSLATIKDKYTYFSMWNNNEYAKIEHSKYIDAVDFIGVRYVDNPSDEIKTTIIAFSKNNSMKNSIIKRYRDVLGLDIQNWF